MDIHEIPQYQNIPAHKHYDVRFLLHAKEENFSFNKEEAKEAAWVNLAELESYTKEESLLRMHKKLRGLE